MSLPYYAMYPKDFDTDENVRLMDDAELGMYLRLMNHAWLNDGLPADPEDVRRMFRYSSEEFAARWPRVAKCFPLVDDRRRNPRQERERAAVVEKSEKASRSAGKRWSKDANALRTHMPTHCEGNARAYGSGSVSVSESENTKKTSSAENPHAPQHDVDPRPSASVSANAGDPAAPVASPGDGWDDDAPDPFERAGFANELAFGQWWAALVKRHPNKNKNSLARGKLRDEILRGRFSRAEFEAWHQSALLDPRWHEAGGHYAPNLYSILDDCLWRHAPPDFTDPQVLERPKRGSSVMDGV